MYVIARKVNDQISIGDNVTITVTEVQGGVVRLCFEAPQEVPIRRTETLTRQRRISRMPAMPTAPVITCFSYTT